MRAGEGEVQCVWGGKGVKRKVESWRVKKGQCDNRADTRRGEVSQEGERGQVTFCG